MQNNIIYDNEKNIYIFGMICDTKNEEDVTYLKVRPFLMDGPNDMRTIRCTFDAKKAASKLTRGDVCIVKVCEDVGNPAKSDAIKFYSPYDTSLYASLYIISGESIKYISIGKPVSQALCPNGSLCLSIDENNRKKNILFTPSKRQVALSNILVALEENRILAVFHKGKDGMQVNVPRLSARQLREQTAPVNAGAAAEAAGANTLVSVKTAAESGRGTAKAGGKVHLNTATAAELTALPGVGDITAQRILEYRAAHGFASIEDVMKVKGIGKGKFSKMQPYLEL